MEDNERLQKTLSQLKTTQSKLSELDQEHDALMDRVAKARRSQDRIGYYLGGLGGCK